MGMGTRRFGAFFVAICWPLTGIYVIASDHATADPVAETRVGEVQIAQAAPVSESSTDRTATATKKTVPINPQANGRAAKPREPKQAMKMKKGRMGEMEIPNEVLFKFGSAELRPEANNVLAECAEMIRRDGNKNMRVIGHTDSTGPAAVNFNLSKRRAQVVTDWLVKEGGIPKEELTAIGVGANKPKASNDTLSGRAQNRRVEVVMPMGGSPHQPMTEENK
jgi:outer membrane protein OmpA-like peptidoglycan-associated protein